MKPKISILDNGLTVVTQKRPYSSFFNAGIWVKTGSRHEDAQHSGLAHLCEHMTFKGTPARSEIELNDAIADIGGSSEAWTDSSATSFCLEVPCESREFAVSLLADIIQNSSFSPEDIRLEKQVIRQEMIEDENDDEDLFDDEFSKLVYGAQSLSQDILGTPETLDSFTRQDLTAFRDRNYVGANMVLSASGNIAHEEITALAKKYFSNLPKGQASVYPPARYIGGFKHIRQEDEKAKIRLGFDLNPGGRHMDIAKVLMGQIFGGEENSRLNTEIRIKNGLVYSIDCDIDNETDTGCFSITAEADAANINKIMDIIISEIRKIRSDEVSQRELHRAQRQLISILTKKNEENDSCYVVAAEQLVNFGKLQDLGKIKKRISATTEQDIMKAAQEIFSSRPSYLAFGKIDGLYGYEEIVKMLRP